MKNPVDEQIQARKARCQAAHAAYAYCVSVNVSQTCQFFRVSRSFSIYGRSAMKRMA